MIHWHCTHPQLKVGGRLMLDNSSSVNTVRILCDFLLTDPNYRFDVKVGDCTVWTEVANNPMVGWGEQPLNQRYFHGYRACRLAILRRARRAGPPAARPSVCCGADAAIRITTW
jgi:hypothetical protein